MRSERRAAPEYATWDAMKQRCTNKNCWAYKHYGARGITVCDRWQDYDNFLSDMGCKPSRKHTIGRIDNNAGYSPDNCRWETLKQQQNNKRDNHIIEYNGVRKNLQQWGEDLGIKPNTILTRIRRGWDVGQALGYKKKDTVSDIAAQKRIKRQRKCLICGSVFYPRKQQIESGNGKYCSVKCSLNYGLKKRWGHI